MYVNLRKGLKMTKSSLIRKAFKKKKKFLKKYFALNSNWFFLDFYILLMYVYTLDICMYIHVDNVSLRTLKNS